MYLLGTEQQGKLVWPRFRLKTIIFTEPEVVTDRGSFILDNSVGFIAALICLRYP